MNQGLAVETEVAALRAFGSKAVDIADIAVGSIKDIETVCARGKNAVDDQ